MSVSFAEVNDGLMTCNFFGDFRELSAKRRFWREVPDEKTAVTEVNPVCGDEVTLSMEVQHSAVRRFHYRAQGCWPIFACLEWLGEYSLGRSLQDCLRLGLDEFLAQVSQVPTSKRHAFSLTHKVWRCALLEAAADDLNLRPESLGRDCKERV